MYYPFAISALIPMADVIYTILHVYSRFNVPSQSWQKPKKARPFGAYTYLSFFLQLFFSPVSLFIINGLCVILTLISTHHVCNMKIKAAERWA
jgi:hypothetical protein